MANSDARFDRDGMQISAGDSVVLIVVPDELIRGLLQSDQEAIKRQVGNALIVEGFDEYGHAELEFSDPVGGGLHTIWIKPDCLLKRK